MHDNSKRSDHDCQSQRWGFNTVGDNVMLNYGATYIYEMQYKGLFVLKQCVYQWKGHVIIWCDKNK